LRGILWKQGLVSALKGSKGIFPQWLIANVGRPLRGLVLPTLAMDTGYLIQICMCVAYMDGYRDGYFPEWTWILIRMDLLLAIIIILGLILIGMILTILLEELGKCIKLEEDIMIDTLDLEVSDRATL